MALNLFMSWPSGAGIVAILSSSPALDVHILVAVLIIGVSARALAVSVGGRAKGPILASTLALGSAVVATAAGWVFAFDGQGSDASLVMSLGFLGVLVAAFLLLGWGTRWTETAALPQGDPARSTPETEVSP